MKLDKKHENRIEFIADDVSLSFANMIRRYSVSRVPVFAIDMVTFYDNTSPLWDEYIAHRLGLMPITTPEKTPADAEVIFSLDSQGPGVAYSTDMKSSDKDIVVAKKIPISTLGNNQHLRFEAKAVIGIGRKHAKYQAGLVSYGAEGKNLRFFVESFFQMEPSEVIARGCDVIEGDIDRIEAAMGVAKKAKKEAKAKKEPKAKKAKEPKQAKAAKEKPAEEKKEE